MKYIFPSVKDRVENDQLNIACIQIQNLMDQLASRQAVEGEPVMYTYPEFVADLEGQPEGTATMIPVTRHAGETDFTAPLYTHPASADDTKMIVSTALVKKWADVDAFNAPRGAAMELKTIAQMMLVAQGKQWEFG